MAVTYSEYVGIIQLQKFTIEREDVVDLASDGAMEWARTPNSC